MQKNDSRGKQNWKTKKAEEINLSDHSCITSSEYHSQITKIFYDVSYSKIFAEMQKQSQNVYEKLMERFKNLEKCFYR